MKIKIVSNDIMWKKKNFKKYNATHDRKRSLALILEANFPVRINCDSSQINNTISLNVFRVIFV